MTSERRFEQDLPALLERLAQPTTPDYRDHIVRQTARTWQRPAWMFPERLLPMTALTSRATWIPRVPIRAAVLVALLLLSLVVGLIVAGGQRQRLPAPFGLAGNGLIAFAAAGDIFTADPLTGASTAVVTGPELEASPTWSRDGTHIAFQRPVGPTGLSYSGQLYVARFDGSEVVPVTREAIVGLADYSFSPEGGEVVFTSGQDGDHELWIARSDGGGVRQLDVGMDVREPAYLPPAGAEILFAGSDANAQGTGLYAVNAQTGATRVILAPSPGEDRGLPRPSPDGSLVAFVAGREIPGQNGYSVHVVSTDGSGTAAALSVPDGAFFQDIPVWSNDGTRLAITRGYAPYDQQMVLAIVPSDGSGPGIETEHRITACCANSYEWSPDDTVILMTPIGFSNQQPLQQILVDPETGATRPAPWTAASGPAWQRTAP